MVTRDGRTSSCVPIRARETRKRSSAAASVGGGSRTAARKWRWTTTSSRCSTTSRRIGPTRGLYRESRDNAVLRFALQSAANSGGEKDSLRSDRRMRSGNVASPDSASIASQSR